MAETTLRGDCALSKRADETWQEFADRMLAVHRVTAEPAKPSSRDALDKLEEASCDLGYIRALCHAALDAITDVHDFIKPSGSFRNDNMAHFSNRAMTLLLLQIDKIDDAERGVAAGVNRWSL